MICTKKKLESLAMRKPSAQWQLISSNWLKF